MNKISMGCVYASPEVISGKNSTNSNSESYPFIHATSDNTENINDTDINYESLFSEVYASPKTMCKKNIFKKIFKKKT